MAKTKGEGVPGIGESVAKTKGPKEEVNQWPKNLKNKEPDKKENQ